MPADPTSIVLPPELIPGDGRFGSGPSKVRSEAAHDLAKIADGYLGTSHRQAGVRSVVGSIRAWNMLNASFHTPVPPQPYLAE